MHTTQPNYGSELAAQIRRRLWAALRQLGDLNRLPTDRELAQEIDELQFRGARCDRRLQRIERDGLMSFGARELHQPERLLSAVIEEFEDECLSRGILLGEIETGEAEPMWVDAEQVVEALRCVLEGCIAQADTGASLSLAIQDDGRYCGFTVRADGVGLMGMDKLDATMIHELLESAGGHVRIEEIDSAQFLITLRLPREMMVESPLGEGDVWAA
jgi:hypothetical protein